MSETRFFKEVPKVCPWCNSDNIELVDEFNDIKVFRCIDCGEEL